MLLSTFTLLTVFVASSLATTTTTATAPTVSEYVLTPQGLRNAANVHALPKGGKVIEVGDEIQLLDAQGNILHVTPKSTAPTTRSVDTDAVDETGWVAYASWNNTAADDIDEFWGSWTVPAAPASYVGQTLFYFAGLGSPSADIVFYSAFQYGSSVAGGGEYWSAADWYIFEGSVYYTTAVETTAGTVLEPFIELFQEPPYNVYFTSFSGITEGIEIGLSETLEWAFVTLEANSVESLANFPSGSTSFNYINMLTTGDFPDLTWTAVNNNSYGVEVEITIDGWSDGEVTFAS